MAKARLVQSRSHHLLDLDPRTDHPHAPIRLSTRPTFSSRTSDVSSAPPRSVLAPLQSNLRGLSSRLRLRNSSRSPSMARAPSTSASATSSAASHVVKVGEKRKRAASGNENAHGAGRLARGPNRIKRQRSASTQFDSDEGVPASEMDVDEQAAWPSPQDSGDEEAFDSSDEHLINEAQPRQLLRLRKDELVRLYHAAGLAGDTNALTKPDITEAIIAARDDFVSLPPSSPPGGIDDNSSEYSSDGGNVAGDDSPEQNGHDLRAIAAANALRRRVTIDHLGRVPSHFGKGRSLSLGFLDNTLPQAHLRASGSRRSVSKGSTPSESPIDPPSRRKTRASHSPSGVGSLPSPPITRQRTRRVSTATNSSSSRPSGSKGKGKTKQVEFSASVEQIGATSLRSTRSTGSQHADAEESDLTELEELEAEVTASERTPRPNKTAPAKLRKTPARKAKGKIGCLREESSASEDDWEEEEIAAMNGVEEEVDELQSSPSPTPPPVEVLLMGRKTPVRKRLRPRMTTQTLTPPSDGDDERDLEDHSEDEEDPKGGELDEVMDEEDEVTDEEEGDETVIEMTPKKLRSGKIVGDDEEEEDEEEEGDTEEDDDEDAAEEDEVEQDIDVDADGDEEEDDEAEVEDENVDLTIATAKMLVRLRRDELVRMCECRDIEVDGTKPQLAEALLQWRDQQTSAPSSTGTARPPSTARPPAKGRRKSSRNSDGQRTPILLRPHVHVEQPATPPVSSPGQVREGEGAKEGEDGELELDLESLGLEDREIPVDKLTKLEKIGSGGFKDVFVGKFKNRKVAIAEFRGQLTAMDIKELKLLGGFDHPNIVRFLGVSIPENTKETPVMIISELCSNGDLFDYVRNVPAPKLSKVLSIMLDIASGLEYLHLRKPSIIHRDCKSSNILITSRSTAKIADFGLAKVKQSTRSMVRSLVGTVNWQAPELWHAHPKYNHKVDVFSCGMVFWEMLQWHVHNKKYPWEGMNEHAIYEAVGSKRQRPSVSGLRKQWCPEIVDLMERMWAQEHQDRPTMTEVVEELTHLVQLYR